MNIFASLSPRAKCSREKGEGGKDSFQIFLKRAWERERERVSKKKIQELYLKIKTLVDKLLQRNSTIGSENEISTRIVT